MVAGFDILAVTQKHQREFFEELRAIISNGELEKISNDAALRFILVGVVELFDINDETASQVEKNVKAIEKLQKSSLVLFYRRAWEKRPYTTFTLTAVVIIYIISWVIHTWSEFSLFWIPIQDFISSIGG